METAEQSNNNKPWLFKKGQSGNPSGRPKGSKSLKTYAAEMLAAMTDEERQEFLHGLPKEVIWKQAEGNPASATDLTSGGEKLVVNLVQYGGNDTLQLPTEAVAVGVSPSSPEVQDSGVAPEGGEVKDGTERPDTQNPS